MIKWIGFIVAFVFLAHATSCAQNAKDRFSLVTGVGLGNSWFAYNGNGIEKRFNTSVFRFSLGLNRELVKKLSVESKLVLGIKFKRSPEYDLSKSIADQPFLQTKLEIDRTLSEGNHFFAEIPIVFGYKVHKRDVIRFGGYYLRYFSGQKTDILSAKSSAGAVVGLSHAFDEHLALVIDWNIGLNKIYSVYQTDGINSKELFIYDRFLTASFTYSFKN